jgi:hypothetical protein
MRPFLKTGGKFCRFLPLLPFFIIAGGIIMISRPGLMGWDF